MRRNSVQAKGCRDIAAAKEHCGENYPIKLTHLINPVDNMTAISKGNDKCTFLFFQDMLSRADLNKLLVRPLKKGGTILDFEQAPELKKVYDDSKAKMSQKGLEVIDVGWRSTNDMVLYVGELVQAQLRREDSWVPGINPGECPKDDRGNCKYVASNGVDHTRTPLFLIERGSSAAPDIAITTIFDGQLYSIPASTFEDTAPAHSSMQIFSYIRERLDQAYAASEQPASNTFVIR